MEIAVVGSLNHDLICVAARLPGKGETVHATSYCSAFGGKGANQAVAAARMGAHVRMIGAIGSDAVGAELRANLATNGIETDGLFLSGKPSGIAMITIDASGDNTIVVYPGANGELQPEWVLANAAAIEKSSCLVLQLEIPLLAVMAAVRIAKKAGIPILLNPAPAAALPVELIASCACITPNETKLALISGANGIEEGAARLLAMGARSVVVTLGSEGCHYMDHERSFRVAAFPIKAVDATAAGDSFNGALAVGMLSGRIDEELLRFANAAGALAASRLGAQPSIPTREEVQAFIISRG